MVARLAIQVEVLSYLLLFKVARCLQLTAQAVLSSSHLKRLLVYSAAPNFIQLCRLLVAVQVDIPSVFETGVTSHGSVGRRLSNPVHILMKRLAKSRRPIGASLVGLHVRILVEVIH